MGTLTQAPPPIEHTGRDPLPLSSGATPIFKFGLPLIIVCALAGLIWSAFAEGLVAILFALFGCGAAILFVSQFLVPLKAVSAVQDGLVITNYRRTIHVPWQAIRAVHRAIRRWDIVEVLFHEPTPFGRTIVFMAGARAFWWSEHPVVAFLSRRAGLSAPD